MRLYQPPLPQRRTRAHRRALFCALALLLGACGGPRLQQGQIQVTVIADGQSLAVSVPVGSTARQAIEATGLTPGLQDRSDPPAYTVLQEGDSVRLTRVEDEFVAEQAELAYETQTLRNESLPEGERRLIQPGVNGTVEHTYRIVREDGVEVSRTLVKTVILQAAVPEVVMVGSQTPFASVTIVGRLAYISAGNAWVIEGNSGFRRPVVTSGDLDGRVLSLSPDGNWLLFTRSDDEETVINTLWAARISSGEEEPLEIDLKVENVIHYADWVPGSVNGVVFSTAEYANTAPGWQANNDLRFLNFSPNGWASPPRTAIETNNGGRFGWWGTDFAWSADGERLAFARPDAVGLVDLETQKLDIVYDLTPLLTRSDWAWMPNVAWSPDGGYLFTVGHPPQAGLAAAEESPLFDLTAVPLIGGGPLPLAEGTGMWAYPSVSPAFAALSGEQAYLVAFLQAINPLQSDTSGYRLVVMDRDGSNKRILFPSESAGGLEPQTPRWAPLDDGLFTGLVVVVFQGDLWLVDALTGLAQQMTGDGLVTAVDWK
ncbi:MAG: G5 domain-containing protein [Chloroflexi bacterium]|nr:G5 domain-containing protein [Chloroflexota bacterium]